MSATLPSPMIVAPAKTLMFFKCLPSGLTTISSVSEISSTTNPKRWPSLQFAIQIDQRQQASAQPVDGCAVDHFDTFGCFLAFKTNEFEQAHLRDGVALAAAGNDQGGNYRQR